MLLNPFFYRFSMKKGEVQHTLSTARSHCSEVLRGVSLTFDYR